MVRISELVYYFEVGRGGRLLRWTTALLGLAFLAYWFDANELRNFYLPEAMEAAQVGRNIANGLGFSTYTITPLSLRLVEKYVNLDAATGRQPHPDLTQPPIYPLILGVIFKMVPPRFVSGPVVWRYPAEVTVALLNQVLFLCVLILTYRFAKKLFEPEVGVLAAGMMAVSDVLWRFSGSGLPTMLAMLWVLLWARCLVDIEEAYRLGDHGRKWFMVRSVLLGLLIGLAGLTRYSLLWLLVPTVVYVFAFLKRIRWTVVGLAVLISAATVAPWLYRNYSVSGALFGLRGYALYEGTLPYPGEAVERTLDLNLDQVRFRDILRKGVEGLESAVTCDIPQLGGHWLGGLFLAGLILRYRHPTIARLRLWVVIALFTLILVQAFGRTWVSEQYPLINYDNVIILLAPLVLMYGAALLSLVLDQMDLPIPELRHFFKGLFIFVAFIPLLVRFLPPRQIPISYPPYFAPWIQSHALLLKADELMMSDIPWAVGWYGERYCIWLPMRIEDFYQINDLRRPVAALYLTQRTGNARFQTELLQDPDYEWSRFMLDVLLHQRLPARFPLRYARQRYLPDQVLLCDRPRWLELYQKGEADRVQLPSSARKSEYP